MRFRKSSRNKSEQIAKFKNRAMCKHKKNELEALASSQPIDYPITRLQDEQPLEIDLR
jgi:hypothetical protein